MRKTALRLLRWGWAVIPVDHRKKFPTFKWGIHQTTPPTEQDVLGWWPERATHETGPGIAVVCGAVSENLVCLDFDSEEAYARWALANVDWAAALPTAKSSRGYHVFFRTEGCGVQGAGSGEVSPDSSIVNRQSSIPSTQFDLPGLYGPRPAGDLISEGKLVVLPPTLHPDGSPRKWIIPPRSEIRITTPEALGINLRQPLSPVAEEIRPGGPIVEGSVEPGQRHQTLIRAAGRLRRAGLPDEVAAAALHALNETTFTPPLQRSEVDKVRDWMLSLAVSTPDDLPRLEEMLFRTFDQAFHHSRGNRGVILDSKYYQDRAAGMKEDDVETAFQAMPEYLNTDDGESELKWIVDGFLPQSYLVILGGTSKAGKSCFVTAMCFAVARGGSFMGLDVKNGGGVLWVCYEESKPERAMALREFLDSGDELPANFFVTHEKLSIDTEEGRDVLRHWIKKTGAKLLIVDPLYGAIGEAESLTDGKTARNALQGLKDLCNETGVTALVIHHFTKNVSAGLVRERLADSNQIAATASMDILMDSQDQPGGSRIIRLACRGRGTFANQSWIVESTSIRDYTLMGHGIGIMTDQVQKEHSIGMALKKIAEEAGRQERPVPELTAERIAVETGLHPKTVRNLLTGMVRRGVIRYGGKQGKFKTYAYLA